MSTARDLQIIALGVAPDAPVASGDLSLALAGAELIDLIETRSVELDDDRIVPGITTASGDRLLDEAASSLVRQEPYESVEDWLWRRGRGLASSYLAALETDGLLVRVRGRRFRGETDRRSPADSPALRHAEARRASGDPVFAALAAAVGIENKSTTAADILEDASGDGMPGPVDDALDDAVEAVLAAVGDAVTELEAVRQRRTIEDAAFDNIWRGP